MTLNRKKEYKGLRLLLCVLFTAMLFLQGAAAGSGEAGIQALNTSGNPNRTLSVDPIGKSEGFSAVLYNNRNGLPTSEANAIAQTGDGFLWIGSYAGLIRYDGNTFERVGSTDGVANVRCLYIDSRDRLWIGTNDAGVFLMTREELRHWEKRDGLGSACVRSLAEGADGLIYIGTANNGLVMIDEGLNIRVPDDERLAGRTVLELRPGSDGLVYGLTEDSHLFTVKNGELITFFNSDASPIEGILGILPDPERPGCLYVGTGYSRIFHGSLEEGFTDLKEYDTSPLDRVDTLEYIDGQIWFCTGNGIGVLDGAGIRILENVPMNSIIEHVMTDFEGNLWFTSTRQGVMKIVPTQFTNLFERCDIPAAVVNSTCLYGGQLFIGTDTGLIVVEDGEPVDSIPLTGAATASGTELESRDLLELLDGARIRSIIRDSRDRLWFSTSRKGGLIRYDHGKVTAFTKEDGLFANESRVVSECEDGTVLVANSGGLCVIRGDEVTGRYGAEEGIRNPSILTVTEGFHQEWLCGSDGDGIYVVSPDGVRRIGTEEGLSSEIVMRIKRSRTQEIYWIITGNSLSYLTPDDRVITIRRFPYPNNYDLYENSRGDVWVLSSAGIYVDTAKNLLSGRELSPALFNIAGGMPYMATANSYSELTPDGDLYIAGREGTIKLNIETPPEAFGKMMTGIPYVDADGKRFYPDEAGGFALPGDAKKVTVYPCVFNFSLMDPQVSYCLEGFDEEPITLSRSKLVPVEYTNLKIGAYQFVLTVKDPAGQSEQTMSFRIEKGKEISNEAAATVIMNLSALFLMGGLLVYTSMYRKRSLTQDRLFYMMILFNMAMTVGETLTIGLENRTAPFAGVLMTVGNTAYYIALVGFPYLLLLYLEYFADPDVARLRERKLLYGIPFFAFAALMLVNLKTGWIFSIGEGNVCRAGFLEEWLHLPRWFVLFYLMLSLIRLFIIDIRPAVLGLLLIVTYLVWKSWFPGASFASFIYALVLVWMHIFAMNRPLTEAKT